MLSQVGAVTREKPLVAKARRMKGPVVVVGDKDSGGTAVAKVLSMLGYTCCSDLAHLPAHEQKGLIQGRRTRLFNAYANIGSLDNEALAAIARSNRGALFIVTSTTQDLPALRSEQVLHLNSAVNDKWATLSDFLAVEYPSFPYPVESDLGKRPLVGVTALQDALPSTDLTFDSSPWILRPQRAGWKGISIQGDAMPTAISASLDWEAGEALDHQSWKLHDDTFPSNLALFTPANFSQRPGECAVLTLREEATPVRAFTSAAIATRESYWYGAFTAELRPSGVPGLITGVFLHRNGPRQEIDIEFLGKDPTKMLVNVYYNPGPGGTKLEYGYRGTPTLLDLGFDASVEFHTYEIDWQPNAIRWKVDGAVVYERLVWGPTPIPDQPLEFNVNLWHSRSTELGGRLSAGRLPSSVELRSIEVRSMVEGMSNTREAVSRERS